MGNLVSRLDLRVKSSLVVRGRFGLVSLTPRELETLCLVMGGKTLAKVAAVMGLSVRTTEYYFLTIKRKMGCQTKAQLMGWVIRHKLLRGVV